MTDSKAIRHITLSLIAAIMIILVPARYPAAQTSEDKTLSTGHITLEWISKVQAGERLKNISLQHPIDISEEQLVFYMTTLNYKHHPPESESRPVFTKEDIEKTKRLLTRALNKVNSQHIIGFEIESTEGTIKGHLFASGGNLHWRFFEIQGMKFSVTLNEITRYGTLWQMVSKEGQKYHLAGDNLGNLQLLNWIEAKLLPAPKKLEIARAKIDGPSPVVTPVAPLAQSMPPPLQPSPQKPTALKNSMTDKSGLTTAKSPMAPVVLPTDQQPSALKSTPLKNNRVDKVLPSPAIKTPVAPVVLPTPAPPQPNFLKPTSPQKNTATLEEILRALKNLYDHQRMDKQEYEEKRAVLIKYL